MEPRKPHPKKGSNRQGAKPKHNQQKYGQESIQYGGYTQGYPAVTSHPPPPPQYEYPAMSSQPQPPRPVAPPPTEYQQAYANYHQVAYGYPSYHYGPAGMAPAPPPHSSPYAPGYHHVPMPPPAMQHPHQQPYHAWQSPYPVYHYGPPLPHQNMRPVHPPAQQPPLPPPKDASPTTAQPPASSASNGTGNSSSKYKTKLCLYWLNSGGKSCKYGDKCNFAHGTEELRYSPEAMASLQRELQFARDQAKKEQSKTSKQKAIGKEERNIRHGSSQTVGRTPTVASDVESPDNTGPQEVVGHVQFSHEESIQSDIWENTESSLQDESDHPSTQEVSHSRTHRDDTQSSVTTDNPSSAYAISGAHVSLSYPVEQNSLHSLNTGEANRIYESRSGIVEQREDNDTGKRAPGDNSQCGYSIQVQESPLASEDPSDSTGPEPPFSDTYLSGRRRFWDHPKRPHRSSGMASTDHYAESYLESSLLERLSRSSVYDSRDNSPLSLVCKASSSTSQEDVNSTASNHDATELFGQGTPSYSDTLWNGDHDIVDTGNESTRTLISSVVEEALSVTYEEDNSRRKHNHSFRLEHLDTGGSQYSPVQTAPANITKKRSFFKEFDEEDD
eukprot:gb/GECG01015286.1/.p1 GENE.gb/GECG01015286.1/~~gb/GECG01015286.1/.p1  ORF type:complete len:614 (+),score=88.69 gb/GECG01015286.1/:1-1842(+)